MKIPKSSYGVVAQRKQGIDYALEEHRLDALFFLGTREAPAPQLDYSQKLFEKISEKVIMRLSSSAETRNSPLQKWSFDIN